jgi:hypothetical protein
MNFEEILIEGERAATFMRLSAIHAATGRAVSYRCAQFLRFSDGELVEFRAPIDSFDAAEQVLATDQHVAGCTDRNRGERQSRRALKGLELGSRGEAGLFPRVFRRQRPGHGIRRWRFGDSGNVGRLVERGLVLGSPRN